MKLILEKDVKNLGKAGDQVSVKPGYARNWLLPQKLAISLNENRLKEWKHKQYIIEVRKKKAGEERDKILARLENIHLVFEKEARPQGQLFGSLSAGEISKALEEKHKLLVDKRDILSEPLKTTGKHKVKIALDSTRESFLSLTIKAIVKKESPQKEEPASSEKKTATQPKESTPETSDEKKAGENSKETNVTEDKKEVSANAPETNTENETEVSPNSQETESMSEKEVVKSDSAEKTADSEESSTS